MNGKITGNRSLLFILIAGFFLISILGVPKPEAKAAVSLVSFDVTSLQGEVELSWVTANEYDTSGFYINRSTSAQGGYTRITTLIPATSGGLGGGDYTYTDVTVQNGSVYYYWLETMTSSGTTGDLEGPRRATPGSTATPTLTQTPTTTGTITPGLTGSVTLTPTQTPTPSPTGNLTRTPTRTATLGSYPGSTPLRSSTPVTPRPSGSATFGATTMPGTSTPTLKPLPSLTLLFPAITLTDTPTPAGTDVEAAAGTDQPGQSGATGKIALMVGIIVLLWVLLGGSLYFFLRRLG